MKQPVLYIVIPCYNEQEVLPVTAPLFLEKLESLIDEIEAVLQNSLDREVSSDKIGELVMDKLKDVDEVAYVRFASVYRQLKDIGTFMNELNKLLSAK